MMLVSKNRIKVINYEPIVVVVGCVVDVVVVSFVVIFVVVVCCSVVLGVGLVVVGLFS